MNSRQLTLFAEHEIERPKPKRPSGGSNNPIVFKDYEAFLAKFQNQDKTTDDTYTPKDVYEAIVKYVGTITDLSDKVILRPFYPGGDYENAEYPENGVVIDNPPFSIFTKICTFYTARDIPFFLFGPALTIFSCCKYCTAVVISHSIEFENKIAPNCNFASNLYGDLIATTAPELDLLLDNCPSQTKKANLPSYVYPEELCSVSDMQTLARGGVKFAIHRDESQIVRDLSHMKDFGKSLFGDHLLLAKAKAKAKAKALLNKNIMVYLTESEKRIVRGLRNRNEDTTDYELTKTEIQLLKNDF